MSDYDAFLGLVASKDIAKKDVLKESNMQHLSRLKEAKERRVKLRNKRLLKALLVVLSLSLLLKIILYI